MSAAEPQRRPGGRSEAVRRAVMAATLDLLAERGAKEVAIAEVARRAGVHETSIYRRWGTSERLILEAGLDASERHIPYADTGSLRSDLIDFGASLSEYLASPLGGALVRAIVAVESEPSMTETMDEFWQVRSTQAHVIFERAATRGEVGPGSDIDGALETIAAPIHFRVIIKREVVGQEEIEGLVDRALGLLETSGRRQRIRRS